ncbi:hypothetical protein F5Y15DRAFT_351858 [Xylariaceae sp. FL0016]|nr:hypothetical protein F5Y15DRAFT_351858 [Xylariaceae sp. FL0016]
MDNSYGEPRRSSYPRTNSGASARGTSYASNHDSYTPTDASFQDRERDRDHLRDTGRQDPPRDDRYINRRDSHDDRDGPRRDSFRYDRDMSRRESSRSDKEPFYRNPPRDDRETRRVDSRSPREARRHGEPPRNLHVETKIPNGPRRPTSQNDSPLSARGGGHNTSRPTPTEPRGFDKLVSNPTTQPKPYIVPKAKDPRLQDLFGQFWRWGEASQRRTEAKLRKDKMTAEAPLKKQELAKMTAKASSFGPFGDSTFRKKLSDSELAVNNQFETANEIYLKDLERLAAICSSRFQTPPVRTLKDPSITKLEEKLEEVTNKAESQREEMLNILRETKQISDDRIAKVESQNKELTISFQELKNDYQTVQNDNKILKDRIADLEKIQQMAECTRPTEDAAPRVEFSQLETELKALSLESEAKRVEYKKMEAGMVTASTQIATLQRKVEPLEKLDIDTLEAVANNFIDHPNVAKDVEKLKKFVEESSSVDSVDERLGREVQSLRDAIDSKAEILRRELRTHSNVAISTQVPTATDDHVKALVRTEMVSLKGLMNEHFQQSEELVSELIDGQTMRINQIEETIGDLRNGVTNTEKWIVAHSPRVDELVGSAADHQLRLAWLSQELGGLDKSLEECRELIRAQNDTANHPILTTIKAEVDDARKKLETVDFSLRTLDSQWSNLSTKHMAESILRQMDPYAQRTEKRVADAETRADRCERACQSLQKTVKNLHKAVDGFMTFAEKRPASPAQSLVDESTKKRKLEVNGRYSPLGSARNGAAPSTYQRQPT